MWVTSIVSAYFVLSLFERYWYRFHLDFTYFKVKKEILPTNNHSSDSLTSAITGQLNSMEAVRNWIIIIQLPNYDFLQAIQLNKSILWMCDFRVILMNIFESVTKWSLLTKLYFTLCSPPSTSFATQMNSPHWFGT